MFLTILECVCVCVSQFCVSTSPKSGPSERSHAVLQRVTSCPRIELYEGLLPTKAVCNPVAATIPFFSDVTFCRYICGSPHLELKNCNDCLNLEEQDYDPRKRLELPGHTATLQNTWILSSTALKTSYFWDIRSTLQCSYWKIDDGDDKNHHDENNNKFIIIIIIIIMFAFHTSRTPQKYITKSRGPTWESHI
jgi:hypothetical protein